MTTSYVLRDFHFIVSLVYRNYAEYTQELSITDMLFTLKKQSCQKSMKPPARELNFNLLLKHLLKGCLRTAEDWSEAIS